jgi:hypothetical protein
LNSPASERTTRNKKEKMYKIIISEQENDFKRKRRDLENNTDAQVEGKKVRLCNYT